MKAKFINEVNFERTNNPKTSIGIGKAKEALDLLEEALNGTQRSYKYYDIEIKSLDDIRVRYSEDLRRRLDPGEKEFEWVLKYYPIDQFEIEDYQNESTFFNQSIRTNQWLIRKNIFYIGSDPDRMTIKEETVCSLEKSKKEAREYAEVIVKALNDQYGEIWVFETMERKEVSQ